NGHLARPSGRVAGKTHGEIDKKLARSCSLYERAEHYEDQDVSSGYRKRNSENAFGRHIKLVEQPHRLDASNKESIGEKYERCYRKRGTNDAPCSFQDHDNQDGPEQHVGCRQIIDVIDAINDVIVIDEQMDDRRRGEDQKCIIKQSGRLTSLGSCSPVNKKCERQREQ